VLLGRYSRSEDVVVGTPLANRSRPELEGLLGYFVNTVALRGDLSGAPAASRATAARVLLAPPGLRRCGRSGPAPARAGDPSFRGLLRRTKTAVQGALENADVPFQQVVADAHVPRSSAYSPLFQNLFTLADASFESALELDGAIVEQAEVRLPRPRCGAARAEPRPRRAERRRACARPPKARRSSTWSCRWPTRAPR